MRFLKSLLLGLLLVLTPAWTQTVVYTPLAGRIGTLANMGPKDCSANPNYPAANNGDLYNVSVAGKIGGASGIAVGVGDVAICTVDGTAAGTQAAVGANWLVLHNATAMGTTSPVKIYPSTDSTTAVQILKADGTTNVLNVDTTNGNVGIGTMAPLSALDIYGNAAQFRVRTPGSGSLLIYALNSAEVDIRTTNASDLSLGTNGLNNLFIQQSTGNVGIGTMAPGARLDILDTTLAGSGSLAGSVLNLAQTWNTTGTPTAVKLNVTNTASNAASLLMDLQVGGVSKFKVSNKGVTSHVVLTVATLPATGNVAGDRSFVSDALAPSFGATVVGGGAVTVPVYFDGTAWKVGQKIDSKPFRLNPFDTPSLDTQVDLGVAA